MIIKELNFILTDEKTANFVVHVGEKITLLVRVAGQEKIETLDGEIRGAYIGDDGEYRLCVFGKYREQVAVKEPSLHEIYLPYIRNWEYPIEE